MNVIAFGSCLSNLTATRLEQNYSFKRINNVANNRSDIFIKNFMTQTSKQIPREVLDQLLSFNDERRIAGLQIIDNQYKPTIGKHGLPDEKCFFDLESEEVDLILLDNFMDISAKALRLKDEKYSEYNPFFINDSFLKKGRESLDMIDFLTPKESVENWIMIINYLKKRFKKAKIIFFSFQYATIIDNKKKYDRSRTFSRLMRPHLHEMNILYFPSLFVRPDLTMGIQDWAHFNKTIYHALAGAIYLALTTEVEFPMWSLLDKFDISKIDNYRATLQQCSNFFDCGDVQQ